MKKPWQQHSSEWEVPWDKRAENKFDPDKIIFKIEPSILRPFKMSISLTGVIALTIFAIAIVSIIL